jgi:hypothetical protein
MSVNIGWSIGWVTPKETDEYNGQGSKIFSAIHTSIGVIFVGIAVMYMARKMTENKEDWMAEIMKKKQLEIAATTEGYSDDIVALFTYYLPKYKVIVFFIIFIVFGFVFIWAAVDGMGPLDALDFVLSTLSGAGYVSLPPIAGKWIYVVVSLYTTTGVPITAIAVGRSCRQCDVPHAYIVFRYASELCVSVRRQLRRRKDRGGSDGRRVEFYEDVWNW